MDAQLTTPQSNVFVVELWAGTELVDRETWTDWDGVLFGVRWHRSVPDYVREPGGPVHHLTKLIAWNTADPHKSLSIWTL